MCHSSSNLRGDRPAKWIAFHLGLPDEESFGQLDSPGATNELEVELERLLHEEIVFADHLALTGDGDLPGVFLLVDVDREGRDIDVRAALQALDDRDRARSLNRALRLLEKLNPEARDHMAGHPRV